MNFERFYSKLPNFIKYNNFFFNASLRFSKKLRNINRKSEIINSQKELLNLLFSNSNIEITGTLRKVQLLYLELLRFVDNVCKKHDINYWIADGTLLGAVRHGGFIPWDDDVDLALLREDYNKLIDILPIEISKFEYLKEECGLTLLRENHKNYFNEFKSVYDVDDEEELLNEDRCLFLQFAWIKPYIKIDFFPVDFIQQDKLDYFNENYVITKYKFNNEVKNGKNDFYQDFKSNCDKIGITNEKTEYLSYSIDYIELFPPYVFERQKLLPLSKIKFEGHEFSCPKVSDDCLRVLYGNDYMQLPEIIETHNIVPFIESQFSSIKEMDETFNNVIEYLKRINDNFE